MAKKPDLYVLSGDTVKIKSTVGAFDLRLQLPNGRHIALEWKKDDFVVEVPTKIEYIEVIGGSRNKHLFHENFAQHLLDSYDFLEVVEIIPEKIAEKPVVVKPVKKERKEKHE